jgi:hypothetical protein
VAWTSDADRYTVLAWAGSTLVVQRDAAGAAPDILALDAPGQVRPLASESSFLGVSPDGTQALIAESPAATPTPRVLLVRIADGTTVASIYVADAKDPVSGEPSTWILGPASWTGDHVAAASSTGLVVLSTSGGLRVDQVLHLDAATKPNAVLFEPRFVDADARTITAWGGIPGTQPVQIAQYACDRFALTCTRGPALAADDPPRPVYDLSGGTR